MPATWIQYGVDALNAGYADPYNPVDAIFAAARYLRAAGAATDLHAAILAYNHSEEYVNSVLLRAKLISTYPKPVIATLTGLVDGRLPVDRQAVAWGALPRRSSPRARPPARAPLPSGDARRREPGSAERRRRGRSAPADARRLGARPRRRRRGRAPARRPSAGAAAAARRPDRARPTRRSSRSRTAASSSSAARAKLGRYVILRDVYGDVFTYAGLGSIAPHLPPAEGAAAATCAARRSPARRGHSADAERRRSRPAPAARRRVTLKVKTPPSRSAPARRGRPRVGCRRRRSAGAGHGKVRLFAHPGNPDARRRGRRAARARSTRAAELLPLRARRGRLQRHRARPRARARRRPRRPPALRDPPGAATRARSTRGRSSPTGRSCRRRCTRRARKRRQRPARRDRQRRVPAVQGRARAHGALRPRHHDLRVRPPATSPPGAIDKRVLARARVPLAQRPEADRQRAALRPQRVHRRGCVSTHYTGDAVDISAINGVADRRPPGRGHDHRPDDPHAADAAGRIRAAPDHQPDAATRAPPNTLADARTLEPHPRRLPPAAAAPRCARPPSAPRPRTRPSGGKAAPAPVVTADAL